MASSSLPAVIHGGAAVRPPMTKARRNRMSSRPTVMQPDTHPTNMTSMNRDAGQAWPATTAKLTADGSAQKRPKHNLTSPWTASHRKPMRKRFASPNHLRPMSRRWCSGSKRRCMTPASVLRHHTPRHLMVGPSLCLPAGQKKRAGSRRRRRGGPKGGCQQTSWFLLTPRLTTHSLALSSHFYRSDPRESPGALGSPTSTAPTRELQNAPTGIIIRAKTGMFRTNQILLARILMRVGAFCIARGGRVDAGVPMRPGLSRGSDL